MCMYVYMYMYTPVQLMRPGIGQNMSCAISDWLTSRPGGCSQPRELWFTDIHALVGAPIYMYIPRMQCVLAT